MKKLIIIAVLFLAACEKQVEKNSPKTCGIVMDKGEMPQGSYYLFLRTHDGRAVDKPVTKEVHDRVMVGSEYCE